ncbi:MAG: class I SAM-dependent methyltransferase [Acidimicrobiales bacterium]|jgi:SAM-dependent methyltransferase
MRTARAVTHLELREHRGDYGFDGSLVGPCAIGAAGVMLAGAAGVHHRVGRRRSAVLELSSGLVLLITVVVYLHTTRRGKFAVWAELLNGLQLRGDERVLDMGCGRGAILAMVAKLIPGGKAVGLDLWTADQSGNRPGTTLRNLGAESVSKHCALVTGDMSAMPFSDSSFDAVLSSAAIHNIDRHHRQSPRRLQAVDEAVRVLKPGQRLMIADLAWASAYAKHLVDLGMEDVQCRSLGWRFWYGPWAGAKLVTATKT